MSWTHYTDNQRELEIYSGSEENVRITRQLISSGINQEKELKESCFLLHPHSEQSNKKWKGWNSWDSPIIKRNLRWTMNYLKSAIFSSITSFFFSNDDFFILWHDDVVDQIYWWIKLGGEESNLFFSGEDLLGLCFLWWVSIHPHFFITRFTLSTI